MGLMNVYSSQAVDVQLNLDLIHSSTILAQKLNQYCSYGIQPYSQKSLVQLSFLTDVQKIECLNMFQDWYRWLNSVESDIVDNKDIEAKEVYFAKKALKFFGLKVDSSFWTTVAEDQVLEIYGLEMKQKYRSFNFFKFSGYSLLDIAVFEWFKLWERPRLIIESLVQESAAVIQNRIPVKSSCVPKHLLLEVMNSNEQIIFQPRACEMQFHNYGVVMDEKTDEVQGIICSTSGRVIARGHDTFRIGTV